VRTVTASERFDYSAAEYRTIERAVTAVRPNIMLTELERRQLRTEARIYLDNVSNFRSMQAWDLEGSKRWQAVEKHCQPLADALADAMADKSWVPDYIDSLPELLATLKADARIFSGRERPCILSINF
jgi:hypothetical protein